nr:MAG: hypothetical protein DIU56_02505 [Pseudomonadota bacterium]
MDFLRELGPLALGTRLKRLSDRVYEQIVRAATIADAEFPPGCFPLFKLLEAYGPLSIGECAQRLGLAHPTVLRAARILTARGWVERFTDGGDRRRSLLRLSAAGRAEAERTAPLVADLKEIVEQELAESGCDLLDALRRVEEQLERHSLERRLIRRALARDPGLLRIDDFTPDDAGAFRELNLRWIRKFFRVEPPDREVLDAPRERILDAGGHILMARIAGQTVGTCALIHHGDCEYELAKMGVDERWQGLGIGEALLRAAIKRCRSLGARRLFLETNSTLRPAVTLYRRMGFVPLGSPPDSKYSRADLLMEYRGELAASVADAADASASSTAS